MKLSLMPKNDLIILTLSMMMINQANANLSCANDCCIVKYMLQQFGKPVNQSDSADNCCSSLYGITCNSFKRVTQINWRLRGLAGAIPAYIGNLTNLTHLYLQQNRLSGGIPESLQSIKTLKHLDLSSNGLSGDIEFLNTFTLLTGLNLRFNLNLRGALIIDTAINQHLAAYYKRNPSMVKGTKIIISTLGQSDNPIELFPNPYSVKDLRELATYPVGSNPLKKRAVVASFPTSFGTFTCATNSTTGSPYQDCINTIAAFCQTSSPLFSIWSECHNKVLTVRDKLNTNWKDYVNSCARFAGGNPSSSYCTGNTTRIVTREVYYYLDASGILRNAYIPQSVTDAIAYIWST